MEIDKNSPEYWEEMLKLEDLWDLDETEDFFVGERLLFKGICNSILEGENNYNNNEINKLIKEIQKTHNIQIRVNPRKSSIELFSNECLDIWKMEKTSYNSKDFSTTEHMMIEIEPRFRGKWFGKIMYETYEALAKVDYRFFLPEIEYTSKASTINLYIKFWFIPAKKIIKNIEYNLDENDLNEIDSILENVKKWNKENQLRYTIKLEKIEAQ